MRPPALARLLLVPAALFAVACDDSPSPLEPPEVDEATLEAQEEPALLEATGRWADGYLLADLATTSSYQPRSDFSYNRSARGMTVTKVAGTTGRYIARFAGLSALLGTKNTVHVTGYGNEASYCKPVGARLAGDTVEVRCFKMGTGAATNAMFNLLASGKRDDRAFAYAHQPTATDYSPAGAGSWNPAGTSRVYRDGVGRYRVVFNGLGARLSSTVGGHLQVNAVGTAKAHCKAIDGWGGSPNLTVNVGCFTPSGAPADTKFSALFVLPAAHLAYAWADRPSATASYTPYSVYSSNPVGGGVVISRQGVGLYAISWNASTPIVVAGSGSVQVTAWGDDSAQCKFNGYGSSTASVRCFAGNGVPMDMYFTVMLHS